MVSFCSALDITRSSSRDIDRFETPLGRSAFMYSTSLSEVVNVFVQYLHFSCPTGHSDDTYSTLLCTRSHNFWLGRRDFPPVCPEFVLCRKISKANASRDRLIKIHDKKTMDFFLSSRVRADTFYLLALERHLLLRSMIAYILRFQ